MTSTANCNSQCVNTYGDTKNIWNWFGHFRRQPSSYKTINPFVNDYNVCLHSSVLLFAAKCILWFLTCQYFLSCQQRPRSCFPELVSDWTSRTIYASPSIFQKWQTPAGDLGICASSCGILVVKNKRRNGWGNNQYKYTKKGKTNKERFRLVSKIVFNLADCLPQFRAKGCSNGRQLLEKKRISSNRS